MTCKPTPPALSVSNPCAMLDQLRGAYYALLSGQARKLVRFNEQWLEYHAGNIRELRNEITRLEAICGGDQPRAVKVGPHRRASGNFY